MNVLGIFGKLPEPGRTKTRLAADIGNEAAVALYSAFLQDLLRRLGNRTDSDLSERCIVAVTPEDADTQSWFSPHISPTCELTFQSHGHLGERIQSFFESAFVQNASRVVLIGSDSPDIPMAIINSAFECLETADMVLAPATDGGYVLVGLSRPVEGLFENIPWSLPSTLTATISAANAQNLAVELLTPWYDIDTVENLGTLLALQRVAGSIAATCPQTQECLEMLWPRICEKFRTQNSRK